MQLAEFSAILAVCVEDFSSYRDSCIIKAQTFDRPSFQPPIKLADVSEMAGFFSLSFCINAFFFTEHLSVPWAEVVSLWSVDLCNNHNFKINSNVMRIPGKALGVCGLVSGGQLYCA